MTKTMIAAFATLAMTGLAPAMTQDDARGADMVLRVFGSGGWSVECTLETDRGRTSRPSARGRGNSTSGTLLGRGVVGGTCTATASNRGVVQLTLVDEDAAFACPFGDRAADGSCVGVLQAGDTFDWTVTRN